MELNIAKEQTGHLMTDLNIPQNRCIELCDVIQTSMFDLARKGKRQGTLAELIKEAVTHAKSDNEVAFICVTAGEYLAKVMEHERQTRFSGSPEELLAQIFSRS